MVTRLKRRQTWLHLAVALAATALVALALGPERSAAARCADGTVPPGNSTVDQYSESIPDQCGDKPFKPPGGGDASEDGGGGSAGGGGGTALPPGAEATLDSLGPDGSAIAAIAASTGAPRGAAGGGEGGGPGAGNGVGIAGGPASPVGEGTRLSLGGVLSALQSALGGGGEGDGVGVGLPLLLALMLLGGVGYALRQRARR